MNTNAFNRLGNCPRCGKLYVRDRQPMCRSCMEEREREYERCRDYLYEHPNSTMQELSKETGVKAEQIVQFILEGRLIITKDNPNLFYKCERCGAPIRKGKLCMNCEKRFSDEVKHIVQKHQKEHASRSDVRHTYRIYKPKK